MYPAVKLSILAFSAILNASKLILLADSKMQLTKLFQNCITLVMQGLPCFPKNLWQAATEVRR